MNIDDVITSQMDGTAENCVVCGKSVAGGAGYMRIKVEKQMVALCCPLCLQTFQGSPEKYTRRQAARAEVHELFALLRAGTAIA